MLKVCLNVLTTLHLFSLSIFVLPDLFLGLCIFLAFLIETLTAMNYFSISLSLTNNIFNKKNDSNKFEAIKIPNTLVFYVLDETF